MSFFSNFPTIEVDVLDNGTNSEKDVQWQPSNEDNTLEGTPDDPRFKYIKYD